MKPYIKYILLNKKSIIHLCSFCLIKFYNLIKLKLYYCIYFLSYNNAAFNTTNTEPTL